jgi:hypothetical protein
MLGRGDRRGRARRQPDGTTLADSFPTAHACSPDQRYWIVAAVGYSMCVGIQRCRGSTSPYWSRSAVLWSLKETQARRPGGGLAGQRGWAVSSSDEGRRAGHGSARGGRVSSGLMSHEGVCEAVGQGSGLAGSSPFAPAALGAEDAKLDGKRERLDLVFERILAAARVVSVCETGMERACIHLISDRAGRAI